MRIKQNTLEIPKWAFIAYVVGMFLLGFLVCYSWLAT